MASRTALVLETNPVITERYLNYTHDTNWRLMTKNTLNDFLDKLQHDSFNLIVAEESLVPSGIIQMLKATKIPFILSTNNKRDDVPTLPRNFNNQELLNLFNELVPDLDSEPEKDTPQNDDAVNDLLSDFEDEEEPLELTSDDVILKPSANFEQEAAEEENSFALPEEENGLFSEDSEPTIQPTIQPDIQPDVQPTIQPDVQPDVQPNNQANSQENDSSDVKVSKTMEKEEKSTLFTPPPTPDFSGNDEKIEDIIGSFAIEKNNYNDIFETANQLEKSDVFGNKINEHPDLMQENIGSEIKSAVEEWMNKNARNIIKEIVMEQLASLSGKNDD